MVDGEWIHGTLYGSPMLQFLASVALVAAVVVLFRLSRALGDVADERYNRTLVEVAQLVTMEVAIVGAAFALAEIWAIPFVYEQALEIVALDRWESVRVAVSVAILASTYLLVRAVHRSFDRLYTEGSITNHQKEVAYHVAGAGIFVVGGLAVLSVWGIALTNLMSAPASPRRSAAWPPSGPSRRSSRGSSSCSLDRSASATGSRSSTTARRPPPGSSRTSPSRTRRS